LLTFCLLVCSEYVVTDQPITLPSKLRRSQLSQTINHLLQRDPAVPFDFLIGGVLLRSSLYSHMEANALSPEEIITLEYILAMPPPPPPNTLALPDWVASVAVQNGLAAAGTYDGSVRLLSGPDPTATITGHTGAVKGLAWIHAAGDADLHWPCGTQDPALVTASQDETLRVWTLPAGAVPRCHYLLQGHSAGVAAVAVQPTNAMVASGCLDASIRLWSMVADDEDMDEEHKGDAAAATTPSRASKRRRTLAPAAKIKRSLSTLSGSGASVRSLLWPERGQLLSAGDDHCVRVWDVQAGTNITTCAGSQVINSISKSALNGLIAAAEFDGRVRLYDARAGAGSVTRLILAAHRTPASTVAWSPSSSYHVREGRKERKGKEWKGKGKEMERKGKERKD
jgi:ribosome biogenesis protein YTM1